MRPLLKYILEINCIKVCRSKAIQAHPRTEIPVVWPECRIRTGGRPKARRPNTAERRQDLCLAQISTELEPSCVGSTQLVFTQ